jgi:N4-gp56 family major capsid protein
LGHPLARKVYGAAVFAEMTRQPTFMNRLTGEAPGLSEVQSKLEKMQTPRGYPIVRVNDLSRSAGDTVSVDMFNILQGRPVTGDHLLAGRMMNLTATSMDVKINQLRGGVDTGGRMTQQRTLHNLRSVGRAALAGWWARLSDQVKLVHMAGARGSQYTPDWVVPLASDADYADIMVNTVTPPTFDKHFYAGDATSMATLDAADILTLEDIDRLRASIDEMQTPMQPVTLPDDPASADEPLYVLLVTSRVWHYLSTRTGEKAWRTFLMNARERGSKNPLFTGEPGMWNGILVKKMPRAIRFAPGEVVTVCQDVAAATTTTSTVDASLGGADAAYYAVDRCLLLGAQGMAEVWGQHSASGTHMSWHEEKTDHDNKLEASISAIGGWSKLRFKDSTGYIKDHGILVIDATAPDPRRIVIP